ncbi:phage integrase N-terminal SAM-like domain-containing protein [Mucilaginibacter mali]|uniref:Phage integrase N-terminal SAM-like domain-containing protein n=1 Tax=Mucilaginibacter mali TaxID=2740462 RepID=A0A7D4TLN4_9SPHI|nr:phage integrase N-terminal SAM-like domain-containing protein [Mucilaginibacter mali]QKJ28414.1 phage integrase N-terminal SAM-like domain-containing protein [Mucilaginibacter mali]
MAAEKSGVKNGVPFGAFRQMCMARRKAKPHYKTPTVIRNKDGDWYIQYYYEHPMRPGEWKPFKLREGLNYIKDESEKETEFNYLRQDVEDWLKAGNSPFDTYDDVLAQIEAMEAEIAADELAKNGWKIEHAEREFIKNITYRGLTPNTINTYKRYVRAFRTWCLENEYQDVPLSKMTEFDLEEFLNEWAEVKNWQGRTFNNYLEFYGSFFDKCQGLERRENRRNGIEGAVVYLIDTKDIELRIVTPERNKPFNPELFELIKSAAKEPGREMLYDYLEWIFYSHMRPDEIRHLKVESIDTRARQIRFVGKTGDRLVPINNGLMGVIRRRGLIDHPQDSFVFGRMGKPGQQRMSVAYFLDQFAEVKRDIGSRTKLGPYNMKHTSVQRMKLAGLSDDEIMLQTGHKTLEAFRAYLADFYIDNGDKMKGATIEF